MWRRTSRPSRTPKPGGRRPAYSGQQVGMADDRGLPRSVPIDHQSSSYVPPTAHSGPLAAESRPTSRARRPSCRRGGWGINNHARSRLGGPGIVGRGRSWDGSSGASSSRPACVAAWLDRPEAAPQVVEELHVDQARLLFRQRIASGWRPGSSTQLGRLDPIERLRWEDARLAGRGPLGPRQPDPPFPGPGRGPVRARPVRRPVLGHGHATALFEYRKGRWFADGKRLDATRRRRLTRPAGTRPSTSATPASVPTPASTPRLRPTGGLIGHPAPAPTGPPRRPLA